MKRNRELGYTPGRPHRRRPAQAEPARPGHARARHAAPTCRASCARYDVDEVIIAMPSAPGLVRRGDRRGRAARPACPCKTLPGPTSSSPATVTVEQLRDVQVEDVLGRAPVEVDFARVAALPQRPRRAGHRRRRLDRQRALPPGRRHRRPAAWSWSTTPRTTCSRSTTSCDERGHADLLVPVIADVQGRRVDGSGVFASQRPRDRLPRRRLQARADDGAQPGRGRRQQRARHHRCWPTSPSATGSSASACISTDKAVEPKTVMGGSPRPSPSASSRRAASHVAAPASLRVRFGNVLGSSGSVRADLQAPDRRAAGRSRSPTPR